MGNDRLNIAMLAYTNIKFDARVIREAIAAKEADFGVDLYILKSGDPTFKIPGINLISTRYSHYTGQNKLMFILNYIAFFFFCLSRVSINHMRKKYNIIHVNNMPNFLIFSAILAKLFGAKVILDIHDLVPELFTDKFQISMNHPLIKFLYFEERISGNFADIVISTNCKHTERFIKNNIKKKNFPEVLNAADERIFTPNANRNFYKDKITIIYPSTITKRYGLDLLVDAVSILTKSHKNIYLKVFGEGEYSDEFSRIISERNLCNFIYFKGQGIPLESLDKELEQSQIGILPYYANNSNRLAMPLKIHEYFIKGLCVIGPRLPVLEAYFEDKILFFTPNDSQDCANKLIQVINNRDLMKEYAARGHEFYKNNAWKKYKKIYQDLLLNAASR